MHSKIFPWDLFNKFDRQDCWQSGEIKSFIVADPYLEKMIKDRMKSQYNSRVYTGNEVTKDFVLEHFFNLSFFTDDQNILILQGELIADEIIQMLFHEIEMSSQKSLAIFFSKVQKATLEILKKSPHQTIELEMPRFWEGQKLLSFCLKELKMTISNELQRFLLDTIEHDFESMINALNLIQLNFDPKAIKINEVSLLISKVHFDFFEMVDLFHENRNDFFHQVQMKGHDFEWCRQFFSSMQGHIVKVIYPEEILKKDRPSKYDLLVIKLSEQSNQIALKNDLDMFLEFEILSKSKDEFLKDRLRIEALK